MNMKRINISTSAGGDYTTSFIAPGGRLYGWFIDINSLAATTDVTWTDDTGRTLDSAVNVNADGTYICRTADTDTATHLDMPPIAGSLTLTIAQGGNTITDGVIYVWWLD